MSPTADLDFGCLGATERRAIRLAEFCFARLTLLPLVISFFPMGAFIWLGIGRRLRVIGLERISKAPPDSSLLFVSNHRSYFDFYAVVLVLRLWARLRHRLYFPVRADFFYDRPLGVVVNMLASGMSMYPPIFRSHEKRALNAWSLARSADLLATPGTALGLHPEGTRNSGGDPRRLLRARSGVGRIALEAPGARVVPVFTLGLGNSVWRELLLNWTTPGRHPVWVAFGPDVDLSDLYGSADRQREQVAARRCRDAIGSLGEEVAAASAGGPPARCMSS